FGSYLDRDSFRTRRSCDLRTHSPPDWGSTQSCAKGQGNAGQCTQTPFLSLTLLWLREFFENWGRENWGGWHAAQVFPPAFPNLRSDAHISDYQSFAHRSSP